MIKVKHSVKLSIYVPLLYPNLRYHLHFIFVTSTSVIDVSRGIYLVHVFLLLLLQDSKQSESHNPSMSLHRGHVPREPVMSYLGNLLTWSF